nr:DUF192 domain-containing protein [Altericroceibacterium endophyticum]
MLHRNKIGGARLRRGVVALVAPLMMLAACSAQSAESASPANDAAVTASQHPISGLEVIPLSVGEGEQAHHFKVEVARTAAEQAKGLMFRTEMGADEGMLFPRNVMAPASFWMKNTVIPLDLIFIGPDGRVLNIAANAVPYSLDPIRSDGPVRAILELNGGRAAELGISPGDRVDW